MANEPANHMTPTRMAEVALEVVRQTGLELEVLDRPQMAELGMGSFLGVAQGSDEPPKFIVMKYEGDPGNSENNLGILHSNLNSHNGSSKTVGTIATNSFTRLSRPNPNTQLSLP